jgi:pimeloyl-ACP methyl ester carboxylesterase
MTRSNDRMALALLLPILGGCSLFYPTSVPIASHARPAGDERAPCLLVMLPGRGDEPADLEQAGLVELVRRHAAAVDVVLVDAHFGYYYERSLIERLDEDVIGPARAQGYQRIWLLGISMGGLGALLYASERGEWIDGLILLAPFLGDDELIDEIDTAGGLAAWRPPAAIAPEDYQRALWSWLLDHTREPQRRPAIYIGWGVDDPFARANGLLAAALPAGQHRSTAGGHQWAPWRALLEAFLRQGLLAPVKTSPTPRSAAAR